MRTTLTLELCRMPGMAVGLVPDAHLAALAIEHGLVLCSSDADFARFPGVAWEKPLATKPPRRARRPSDRRAAGFLSRNGDMLAATKEGE